MSNDLEYFEIRDGKAEPIKKPDPKTPGEDGHVGPTGESIVILPDKDGKKERRIVLYAPTTPRPWPLAGQVVVNPPAFTSADLRILQGGYLPALIKRALKLGDDGKWTLPLIIAVIMSGLGVVLSASVLILCFKVFRDAGLV